ncbi:glucose-6-phosphate isomerase [Lipingzhangella halophila]|uniref:Glucose-6-phosphate isomerase n=1 Tax=Lipingzhangella halophila TaxID=1783352 RepID=A0A7W7RI66_9ACTN|nr:glucose-6-phosphate isomerase [Lipingzhangella halophila]MBB4932419.1 glucose-6-phosphate isomerase [Lipingzhangella halophila]
MTSNQVRAGNLTVEARGAAADAAGSAAKSLADDGVAARLAAKDTNLWGPAAAEEATIRLNWLDLPRSSRALLPELAQLAADARAAGLDRVVLAGMGGSSLAPEVITADRGVDLVTLDTTDPGQIRRVLANGLQRTALVVSSKSGGTVETDSHRRVFESAFRDAGIDPAERITVVTDPGSPLAELAAEHGYRTFLADPHVGGRYSALSAFGLVPSALAGVDVEELLDEAEALVPSLGTELENPTLLLGAALGGFSGHDKVVLTGEAPVGLGDWIEQLVAESTGKDGTGLLPVVVESPSAPGTDPGPDRHLVTYSASEPAPVPTDGTAVSGPLGAHFLAWEYATAIAGHLLGIDPFNQPNVQESKDNTRDLLERHGDTPLTEGTPLLVDDDAGVRVHATSGTLPGDTGGLDSVLRALLSSVPDSGYLAVMAYLDRDADSAAAALRASLAAATSRPVTFGWGPRFLHSTGQYHKGGPANGVFLQITGENTDDLEVPGRPYTFGELQLAQALGDFGALGARGRPVVRLHLPDRAAGLARVREAVDALRR